MMGVNMSKLLLPPKFNKINMSPENDPFSDDVPFKVVPFVRGYREIFQGK